MRKVYLDHNATTPLHPEVLKSISAFLEEDFGNPSSLHQFGRKVRAKMEDAREQVASLMNADPSEIVFTSGGSEANNLAIKGMVFGNGNNGSKGHIIASAVEHPAVLSTCGYLEKKGISVSYVPVDKYGLVSPERVAEEIKEDTILISIQHSNNEIGTIEPISEIVEVAKKRGVPVHSDAVQSFGKVPVDVKALGVDMLSVSAHKLNGPKGVGALFVSRGCKKLTPLIHGGGHEKKRRAGTENTSGIIGFGKACEIAEKSMEKHAVQLKELRDRLERDIQKKIPQVRLNGHPEKRLPTTLNMSFDCVEGESLLINLDLAGIAISTGSACSSGSLSPSHVLLALGIPDELVHGSLRFCFGLGNEERDIDYVMEHLPAIVQRIREMSPLWDD
ncbi:MAG: cysteine desulfurase NifS [Nitrospinota bacterium]